MSERPPQLVSVTCPRCGNQFAAPILNVLDVGRHPEFKAMLLQGAFTPNTLNLTSDVQQRLIGDMTNAIINSIPPEQRKAYLLQPKIFLTLPSLVEAILQADGVTPEMLEAQRAKSRLVEQFLQVSDELELQALAAEHDEDMDYDFFAMLSARSRNAC